MKNQGLEFPENLRREVINSTGAIIRSGAVVIQNGRAGIAIADIADGASGIVVFAGRYTLASTTGTAFAQGDLLAWDAANTRVTLASTDATGQLPLIGRAATAKASGAASVQVDLAGPHDPRIPRRIVRTVTNAEAAANSTNGRVDIATGVNSTTASQRCTVEVRTAVTGRVKAGYDVTDVSLTPGTIRVDGVASGTQIDENDVVIVTVHPEG